MTMKHKQLLLILQTRMDTCMVKMIVLGLPLDLGTALQVHMNIFKMQSPKWRIRSATKYRRLLLDLVQVKITYEIVNLPVKHSILAFAFAQFSRLRPLK